MICLAFSIWPFQCQVSAVIRALFNVNTHVGQHFPFQAKRMYIEWDYFILCTH